MKKIVTIVALSLFGTSSFGQAVEEGNVIIDAYYGFPNLYTTVFQSAYANSGSEINVNVGGIGPLGGRVEYMLADKVGLGVDIAFSNSSVAFQSEITTTDPVTFETTTNTYDYDFATNKIGAMVTFNYHFLDNDQLDAYAMVGAGYKNRNFSFTSTEPGYEEATVSGTLLPVASRIGVGMRYFFTDNIGLNLALGFGQGGILNGGISAKF